MMCARDIMTQDVLTIGPEASIHDAARLLSGYNISGVPVVDSTGRMVGIVTSADLLSKEGATVAEIMTVRVTTAQEDTPVEAIAQALTSSHYKRLPIVRGMASRWVCGVCGAEQAGLQPIACASCGAAAA